MSTALASGALAQSVPGLFDAREQSYTRVMAFLEAVQKPPAEAGEAVALLAPLLAEWRASSRGTITVRGEADPTKPPALTELEGQMRAYRDRLAELTILIAEAERQKDLAENLGRNIAAADYFTGALRPNEDIGALSRRAREDALKMRLGVINARLNDLTTERALIEVSYPKLYLAAREITKGTRLFPSESNWPVLQRQLEAFQDKVKARLAQTKMRHIQGEDAVVRAYANQASRAFVEQLMLHPPIQVTKFRLGGDDDAWSMVEWPKTEATSPTVPIVAVRQGYDDAIKILKNEIATLDAEIAQARDLLRANGEEWKKAEAIVFANKNTVADAQVYLAMANALVELSVAVGGFLATGGLSAMASWSSLEAMARAAKENADAVVPPAPGSGSAARVFLDQALRDSTKSARRLTRDMFDIMAEVAERNLSQKTTEFLDKIYLAYQDELAQEGRKKVAEFMSATMNGKIVAHVATDGKYGYRSYIVGEDDDALVNALGKDRYDWREPGATVVVSDTIETLTADLVTKAATGQAGDVESLIKLATTLPKAYPKGSTVKLSTDVAGSGGAAIISIAGTAIKVLNTMIYNDYISIFNDAARRAAVEAGAHKARVEELSQVLFLLEDDRAYKQAFLESLEQMRAKGPPLRERIGTTEVIDREDFDKIGRWYVSVTLSRPLLLAPKIQANGIEFDVGRPTEDDKTREQTWRAYINTTNLPPDTTEVVFTVAPDPDEPRDPYNALDIDPTTPPILQSISRDGWIGFEKGTFTHRVTIRPAPEHRCIYPQPPSDPNAMLAGGLTWAAAAQQAKAKGFDLMYDGCDIWQEAVVQLPCPTTTAWIGFPMLDDRDGTIFTHPVTAEQFNVIGCAYNYNTITGECLDDLVPFQALLPGGICLDQSGALMRHGGAPYQALETERPGYFNINSTACAGADDITTCPAHAGVPVHFLPPAEPTAPFDLGDGEDGDYGVAPPGAPLDLGDMDDLPTVVPLLPGLFDD